MTLIPDGYDTRETFRARFAAAYDDGEAMKALCHDLRLEAEVMGSHQTLVPGPWWNADLPHLRELALNLEHTLYALAELQQAYRCAAGSVKAGDAA